MYIYIELGKEMEQNQQAKLEDTTLYQSCCPAQNWMHGQTHGCFKYKCTYPVAPGIHAMTGQQPRKKKTPHKRTKKQRNI